MLYGKGTWDELTNEELNAYIAIFIVMGIKKLPSIDMYWSSNPMIGCPWISNTMTRNRFQSINRFLHLADNEAAIPKGQPGYNPLFKVQPIIDHMKRAFSSVYYPRKHLSVDEAMIAFNGRLSFKQYIPSKPTKWGIKCWEICDSFNGYCLDFNVYTGKAVDEKSKFGVGFDVIKTLTGVDIIKYLLENGTYGCGTIRANRKGLPKNLKALKLRRGEVTFFTNRKQILCLRCTETRNLCICCLQIPQILLNYLESLQWLKPSTSTWVELT